jgi:hypothetical protein
MSWLVPRRVAGWLLLSVFAVNGCLEISLVARECLLLRERPATARSCCDARAQRASGGCCGARGEVREMVIVCTCKCCGPVCPMGEKCTCNSPKIRVPLMTAFLAPIGCHEGDAPDAAATGKLLPRFTFIMPAALSAFSREAATPAFPLRDEDVASVDLPPETPPPRSSTAPTLS